ncbi:hypothetical protein KSP40_PGU005878 [Platanthera guangdongensis]|uniref:Uncharacterized protein n=1 Tax=Platanthera guangdongensis TaxID=2320717 RepID=A0ABR2MF60_9ASPA
MATRESPDTDLQPLLLAGENRPTHFCRRSTGRAPQDATCPRRCRLHSSSSMETGVTRFYAYHQLGVTPATRGPAKRLCDQKRATLLKEKKAFSGISCSPRIMVRGDLRLDKRGMHGMGLRVRGNRESVGWDKLQPSGG